MRPPKPSTIPLSKVPSIKQLCEVLGFQHATLKDTNAFMENTRAWRKSYKLTSGRDASRLLRWNDAQEQLDLEELAQKFIDYEGNGERFWGENRSWNHISTLQYPENRAK